MATENKKVLKLFIPWARPRLYGQEKEYLLDALKSTWISGGPYVERFTSEFIKLIGASRGVTVSNGTTALHLALMSLDIGPGDEVIVPGFSFAAPANMVIAVGATPVYADIDPKTWLLDPRDVERCITPNTKAIIPVHLYGNVCDMDTLSDLAAPRKIALVEDTAQAALSRYKSRYAGTLGEIGTFSFQATKTITMGEGGFVTTKSEAVYTRMRLIANHGMQPSKRYWHKALGFNFRLTNLQAAVGCAQLQNVPAIIARRAHLYTMYHRMLSKIEGIELQGFQRDVDPVVWAFALKLSPGAFGDRDSVMMRLKERGIETRNGFYPFCSMPLYDAPDLPITRDVSRQVISLPFHTDLEDNDIRYICNCLKELKR